MQLLLLGLLVLLILIGQIYKIITDKNKLSREAFDMVNKNKNQIDYLESSIRYYKSLGDKGLQDTIEEIEKTETSNNFVALDSNNILIETFGGTRRNTENKIETCRSLTKCGQLDDFSNCGYCGTTGKFDYNGGGEPAPDVCPKSKKIAAYSNDYRTTGVNEPNLERGNQWAETKYDCMKVQRQNICDKITTCTSMAKGTEIGKLCGWCPSDSRAKVKTSGPNALLKYDGTGEDLPTISKITSDKCPEMGMIDPTDPTSEPLFSKLTQAGSCAVCDEPINGVSKGATGLHSKKCLQSLWSAAYVDPSGVYNVSCTTNFDDIKTANEGHYLTGNTGQKSYLKIAAEMKKGLKRPIAKFMKEHDELNSGGNPHWGIREGKYRRGYNLDGQQEAGVDSIDKMWKKCFGENSKGNVEDNFGQKNN